MENTNEEKIVNTFKNRYGINLSFKKNDVVVWKGMRPAILKIGSDCQFNPDMYGALSNCATPFWGTKTKQI